MNFQNFKNYVDKLYQSDKAYDDTQTDRLARHRHLEPESAKFLASLAIAQKAQIMLEIGTSTGYSTLWLAYASYRLDQFFPSLISIDIDADRLATAQQHLKQLGLDEVVRLEQADAKVFLAERDIPFDMIFLDAERKFYGEYVKDLKRLLIFQSMLVVDNVISHADEVADFLAEFENDDNFLCTTLPIGAGLFMAVKQRV